MDYLSNLSTCKLTSETELLTEATELYKLDSGLVDKTEDIPTLIIPDIHARRQFILDMFNKRIKGKSVFDHFVSGDLRVVFTGDAVHSEKRGENRWRQSEKDFRNGNKCGPAIQSELLESLNTVKMLSYLKTMNPDNFFHLRGNHDDVIGIVYGEYGKYCRNPMESTLMNTALNIVSKDLLNKLSYYENKLPLMFKSPNLTASHCVPAGPPLMREVKKKTVAEFGNFAWSDNTYGVNSWVEDYLRRGGQWVIGHRPVFSGSFTGTKARYQVNNQLIQVNAPDAYMYTFKLPGRAAKVYCLSKELRGLDIV